MGKVIEKSILNYYCRNLRGLIPYFSTITTWCILGRVQLDLDEEERSPKNPPLTLTTIIKPPSNKGKEKVKEIEEERREIEDPEQALILSNEARREERQSSPSFDWMHEQPIEAYQNEQSESSMQQGDNVELIEMMTKME